MKFTYNLTIKRACKLILLTTLLLLASTLLHGSKIYADSVAEHVPGDINTQIAGQCAQGFSVVQISWIARSDNSQADGATTIAYGSSLDLSIYIATYRCRTSDAQSGATYFDGFSISPGIPTTPKVKDTYKTFGYPLKPGGYYISTYLSFNSGALYSPTNYTTTLTSRGTITYGNGVGTYCAIYKNGQSQPKTKGATDFTGCVDNTSYYYFDVKLYPVPPLLSGYKITEGGAHDDVTQDASGNLHYSTSDHSYPFSDDWIQAFQPKKDYVSGSTDPTYGFVHSIATNPFYWNQSQHLYNGQVEFTSQEYGHGSYPDGPLPDGSKYVYAGFTICDNGPPSGCDNINSTSSPDFHAAGAAVTILENHTYTVRFIYTKTTPAAYSCGNVQTSVSPLQVNTNYSGSFSVSYTGTPAYDSMEITPGANPSAIGSTIIAPKTSLTDNGTSISYSTGLPPQSSPGVYNISWQLYNAGSPVGSLCSGVITVYGLPYYKVTGADIRAGGDFSPACTDSDNDQGEGIIGGWYNSQTAQAGASSLFAAIAEGQITGLASGQNPSASPPPGSPARLSFSNSQAVGGTDLASPTLGGQFDDNYCLYTPKTPTNTTAGTSDVTINGSTNGTTTYTGDVNLHGGAVGNSHNVAMYVTGNVYIDQPLTYGSTSWSSIDQVPSFTLVVTGNIFVAPSVAQLDGIYVAEPVSGSSTPTGEIYTCGNANYTPVDSTNLASCNTQLTVNGTFTADKINLMRSYGSLKDATSTESPNSGVARPCTNSAATSKTCAAEVFNFSPEMYLSDPGIAPSDGGTVKYDTISSLPPVL